jgi:hypothetical protein
VLPFERLFGGEIRGAGGTLFTKRRRIHGNHTTKIETIRKIGKKWTHRQGRNTKQPKTQNQTTEWTPRQPNRNMVETATSTNPKGTRCTTNKDDEPTNRRDDADADATQRPHRPHSSKNKKGAQGLRKMSHKGGGSSRKGFPSAPRAICIRSVQCPVLLCEGPGLGARAIRCAYNSFFRWCESVFSIFMLLGTTLSRLPLNLHTTGITYPCSAGNLYPWCQIKGEM